MAVQAQHLSHDLHAYNSFSALEDELTGGSLFFPENLKRGPELEGVGRNTLFGDVPRVDLTWYDNTRSHGFVPRKRARVVPEAPSYLGILPGSLPLPWVEKPRAESVPGCPPLHLDAHEIGAPPPLPRPFPRRRFHASRGRGGNPHSLPRKTGDGAGSDAPRHPPSSAPHLRFVPPAAVTEIPPAVGGESHVHVKITPRGLWPWAFSPLLPNKALENQRGQGQGLVPVRDVLTRAVGSGTASTSGRMINAAGPPQDLLSQLYHQGGMEIDAVLRVETDRMRAGLEEARQQHVRALVSAAERAAARRLRAAEAALELARCRNAKLSERLSQICAEGQAWIRVAKGHEAVAAGLQATLDQLLQSPCAAIAATGADEEGDAEDARSCCFETPAGDDAAASKASACKACGEGESCVLLLPCRHLCLCSACDTAVDTCPLCATTKNASLHVLLS